MAVFLDPEMKLGEEYVDGGYVMEEGTVFDFLSVLLRNVGDGGRTWWTKVEGTMRTVFIVPGRSPRRSLDSGLAMIPESRKDEGLIFSRSSIENATLSRLRRLTSLGVVRRARERRG